MATAKKAPKAKKSKKVAKKKIQRKAVQKVSKKTVKKVKAKKASKKVMKKRPQKKLQKKIVKKPAASKGPIIGKVKHYYDRIGVAVVALQATVRLGDRITLSQAGKSFSQKISSMQVNHTPLTIAHAGQVVGMKVDKVANEGTKITAD